MELYLKIMKVLSDPTRINKRLLRTIPAISRNKVKQHTDNLRSKHPDKQGSIYPFSRNHLTTKNLS